jgi:myosin VI
MDAEYKKIWITDPQNGGFRLGKLVDIGSDSLTVEPFDSPGKTITAPHDSVFPCEEYETKDVDDNCALMYLNEANLLNNIRLRYSKDVIYVRSSLNINIFKLVFKYFIIFCILKDVCC